MYLTRLVVNNFRVFYGKHVIEFSPPGARSVTVIHGENGAGKTNFLNAIFWCVTGRFTPRLRNPEALINWAAYGEDRQARCFVELHFRHDERDYQAIRTMSRAGDGFSVYWLDEGVPKPIPKPDDFIERLIPKGLARWFFYDAEAIGELELSGTEGFRQSLRRILGFELVDTLSDDLGRCLTRKQGALARISNSRDLENVQKQIASIEHVLPSQKERRLELEEKARQLDSEVAALESQLRGLPRSKPLQEARSRLTDQRSKRLSSLKELRDALARHVGESAPAILLYEKAVAFEEHLRLKENTGRLPAPYSEQLVEDLLQGRECLCGRPIAHGSCEEGRIKALLQHAATSEFNERVRSVQFAVKEIRGFRENFTATEARLRRSIDSVDSDITDVDEQLRKVREQLESIDVEAIRAVEKNRSTLSASAREAHQQEAVLAAKISENESKIRQLRTQYDALSARLGQGKAVTTEIDKIKRLLAYVQKTLQAQELRALNILQVDLNRVLRQYLTKHFVARIDPSTYRVELLDQAGRPAGDSTGEGQVLKFAFITTVVSLAAKKTQEKINFLAEPTAAPLVLDAPFSALDPEYQSTVAKNVATQTSQVVLLISSAGWSARVAEALGPFIGRRYALISRQAGPRDAKPIKTMEVNGKILELNEFDSIRDDSTVVELP